MYIIHQVEKSFSHDFTNSSNDFLLTFKLPSLKAGNNPSLINS